jgi:hypothetical protein
MSAYRVTLCVVLTTLIIGTISARACPPATVELVPCGDVTTWPGSPQRWKDIATNLYSESYQDTGLYEHATVTATFNTCGESTFAGHLSAEDLKPNFAYQVKIVGKPERLWGEEGDDKTNENIGYTGRWWRVTPNPGNSNDQDYEAHHDEPGYIYEGYLVFDFFVTDRFGRAELDFATESSYHVLWWEHQRTRGACDSPVKWSTVTGYATDPAYDADIDSVEVGVYAEIERLCHGETTLPEGFYNCRFLLTEESFHQSGEDEGYWASVMVCDSLFFRISSQSQVDRVLPQSPLVVKPMWPNPFREESFLAVQAAEPALVRFTVYGVCGRVVRSVEMPLVTTGEYQIGWNGRDATGHQVADGLYLYRVEIPGICESYGKVVLLR